MRPSPNRVCVTAAPVLDEAAPKPSVTTSSSASSSSRAKRFTNPVAPRFAGPVSVTVPAASTIEPNPWTPGASVKSVPSVPPSNTSGTVTASPAASARRGVSQSCRRAVVLPSAAVAGKTP